MTSKLTDEQRQALQADPGKPLRVEDDQTHKVYLVVAEEDLPTLWKDYLRREVKVGLDAIDRGEIEDWDVESVKREGREILRQRPVAGSLGQPLPTDAREAGAPRNRPSTFRSSTLRSSTISGQWMP